MSTRGESTRRAAGAAAAAPASRPQPDEPAVSIRGVHKDFGDVNAVRDVSLDVFEGEIVSLVGPSGCGKSTMLRCLSGLEELTSGEIWIGGHCLSQAGKTVDPSHRNVGLVFQSYAIWPHLSVLDNVGYGLRARKVPRAHVAQRSAEVIKLTGLSGLEARLPGELSGGQQQRVALARSLVVEPRVLLLDEPLSNLDAALRDRMRRELRRILKAAGITSIYVTHDQNEAFGISDRIAVMSGGELVQLGTPREIYETPATTFVARFLGGANAFRLAGAELRDGEAVGTVEGLGEIRGRLGATDAASATYAVFRPETAQLRHVADGERSNCWRGTVVESWFSGAVSQSIVETAGGRLRVSGDADIAVGREAHVHVNPTDVLLLPGELTR
jgi:ABC-type Fe3+/spermidine/putrescine transport system ATPase subunit